MSVRRRGLTKLRVKKTPAHILRHLANLKGSQKSEHYLRTYRLYIGLIMILDFILFLFILSRIKIIYVIILQIMDDSYKIC